MRWYSCLSFPVYWNSFGSNVASVVTTAAVVTFDDADDDDSNQNDAQQL